MTSSKLRPITDIPDELFRDCIARQWNYTVGFVRVEESKRSQDAILIGSGVLVSVEDERAILTADHVLDNLPRSGRLGLILSDKSERTTIDVSEIEYKSVDRCDGKGGGPDIGAILLFEPVASALGARKSFYNLDIQKDRLLNAPPDIQNGIWIVQGFVEEMTVLDPSPLPYERVKAFCQFGAVGGVEDYVSVGDHDYYTFPLTVPPSESIPENFGGCSGGGLWHVLLKETEEGEPAIQQSLLQGLCYWQEPPQNGLSALKCHGQKSIYDVAYSIIGKHAA